MNGKQTFDHGIRLLAVLSVLLLVSGETCVCIADSRDLAASQSSVPEDAFRQRMTARAVADRGFVLAHHNELARALTLFSASIEIDPTYVAAYYYRAAAHIKRLDFNGAIPDLDKVLKLDPHYPAALNDRGFARWQTGDLNGALVDFDSCIALRTNWGLPFANRAALKASLGDAQGATADLKQALQIDPTLAKPNEQSLALGLR